MRIPASVEKLAVTRVDGDVQNQAAALGLYACGRTS
jgi:hypothetical protein